MKKVAYIAIIVAAISLIVGIISRWTVTPVALAQVSLKASVLLAFTNTCLLIAITFILLGILKKEK